MKENGVVSEFLFTKDEQIRMKALEIAGFITEDADAIKVIEKAIHISYYITHGEFVKK